MWQSKKKVKSVGGIIHYSSFTGYPKAIQNYIRREFPKFNPSKSKIIFGNFQDIAFIQDNISMDHTIITPIEIWDISVGYSEEYDILFINDPVNFRLSNSTPDLDFMAK